MELRTACSSTRANAKSSLSLEELGMSRIAVIGAGAWGTALSIVLARGKRHTVRLWAYEPEVCDSIRKRRTNDLFLTGYCLPEEIEATNSLPDALAGAGIVLAVMPSHHARALYLQMRLLLPAGATIVSATKGI